MQLRSLVVLVLGAVLLSGCTSRPEPPMSDEAACRVRLSAKQVVYQVIDAVGDETKGCGVHNPVKVSQAEVAWSQPAVVNCSFAEAVLDFEEQIVQPAAMRHFGKPVSKLRHMGTYSCRNKTGGLRKGLSEHAFGRAIDVGGFELADGTVVDVKRDWMGAGAKSAFLQDVARQACRRFSVVLTPNYDSYHKDHLHLDVGTYRVCGM